jgi:hypothetical protein
MNKEIPCSRVFITYLKKVKPVPNSDIPMPALANAGPDCDLCGGPLKVIVQNKKKD